MTQTWAKAVDGPSPPQKCLALKSMNINHFAPFKFRIRDGPCGSNFGSAHRKPQTCTSPVHVHWTLPMAEQRHTCGSKRKCHNSKICTSKLLWQNFKTPCIPEVIFCPRKHTAHWFWHWFDIDFPENRASLSLSASFLLLLLINQAVIPEN